ncbi:MAG TPA: hypothetical protein VKA34_21875 [Balneolales bacterium]|nr:hypothetical protein [Balneolales bacterium]
MEYSYKLLRFGIYLLGIGFLTSCGSHKKENNKETATKKENVSHKDTSTVKPVKEKYSPGTAEITARVIMYNETNPYAVTLKVLSVKGYGSSTPPLAPNNKLKVNISKGLLNKHTLDDIKKEFTSVKPITVTLSSKRGMALGKQTGPSWTIIDYH